MSNLLPHSLPNTRSYPDTEHFDNLSRLGDDITEMAAHLDAGTFQLLEMIGHFDEDCGWNLPGVLSSATAPALLYLLRPCSRVPTG